MCPTPQFIVLIGQRPSGKIGFADNLTGGIPFITVSFSGGGDDRIQSGEPVIAKAQGGAVRTGDLGQQVKGTVSVAGRTAFAIGDRRDAMLAVILQFLGDAIGKGDFIQTAINETGVVRAVLVAGFLFQCISKTTQATQRIQFQSGGFAIRCHHSREALVLVISIVPLTSIR
ncbi:hypothetical protein Xmau_04094 [Xenorhabdus mauleonii]|uniref:Uncharacterized protein n=1 Tax=Xenorhabdus mauleonii TaxID=351675 RepID=A0A2G0NPX6_9GAMM|nr:hypothetical protein Xmau_04094 [Xenorhabdus mauleonii]